MEYRDYSFKKFTQEDEKNLKYMENYFVYDIGENEEVVLFDRVIENDNTHVLVALHLDKKTRKIKRSRMATVEDINQVMTYVRNKMDECFKNAINVFVQSQMQSINSTSPGKN